MSSVFFRTTAALPAAAFGFGVALGRGDAGGSLADALGADADVVAIAALAGAR